VPPGWQGRAPTPGWATDRSAGHGLDATPRWFASAYCYLVATADAPPRDDLGGWRRSPARVALLVASVSFFLGVLTAYAQGWLPEQIGSLANSSGSWALVAFLLAMLATTPVAGSVAGALSLVALLGGYVVGAGLRDFPSSTSLIVFWGVAALLVGPLLGLGGYWVKDRPGPLAAIGVGAMSGVLIGEGAYGLAFIADTTSPPYWWGSIGVGLTLLLVVAVQRLTGLRDRVLAAGMCAGSAVAFVVVYTQGSSMFSLLS